MAGRSRRRQALLHGDLHTGNVALQGCIKVTFDEGVYLGWFNQFTVTESAEQPFAFKVSFDLTVHREEMTFRTAVASAGVF